MNLPNWKTEQRKVSDLKMFKSNPRTMTQKQVKDLRTSILRFGLVEIPVINTDNTIVAGHQRIQMLIAEGMSEQMIDVRVPDRALTEKEVAEYCIRSNKNTGGWDDDGLQANFEQSDLLEWGFEKSEFSSTDNKVEFDRKNKRKLINKDLLYAYEAMAELFNFILLDGSIKHVLNPEQQEKFKELNAKIKELR